MYANNFQFQPLSPSSDNEDWLTYIKTEPELENQHPQSQPQPQPFEQFVQTQEQLDYLNDDFGSYLSSTSPQEHDTYHINLDLVNDKLNDISSSCSSEPSPDMENDGDNDAYSVLGSTFESYTTDDSSATSLAKPRKGGKRRAPRKKLTETQKAAHNIIEKKYRININTKIENLQRLIPSITTDEAAFKTSTSNPSSRDFKSKKLNKSLILDKAIEYITLLQKNQTKIVGENAGLRKQLNNNSGLV